MFDLDQETIDALEEYNKAVIAFSNKFEEAMSELIPAQKHLIHAGQGLQGFLKDVRDYRISRQIKAKKS